MDIRPAARVQAQPKDAQSHRVGVDEAWRRWLFWLFFAGNYQPSTRPFRGDADHRPLFFTIFCTKQRESRKAARAVNSFRAQRGKVHMSIKYHYDNVSSIINMATHCNIATALDVPAAR
jgi:hypothetical protein